MCTLEVCFEIDQVLLTDHTWFLVPPPKDKKIIGCMYVLKLSAILTWIHYSVQGATCC